ncbi:flagellar basal-body rod protein FlgG [Hahella aquimaris]|uniref:flagellar basal-body rod protein FlgG n=1 Tax=Hahella sp. HNIBRBA332 TaxID=3015983 RepID=UPI00273BF720|nr:flagellar basal-body rod protein FlgG [Hahella sp. HNIBRBA332]WLQ15697.1 flagellar basal-body rod protein FlgG [Hahella sp. HNIBRBA332]
MIDALYVAETGLQAGQKQIETISNNMANLNTIAYKKSRVAFGDLISRQPATSAAGRKGVNSVGMGTKVAEVTMQFDSGDLKVTENQLDLAIRGDGFFEVMLENGEYGYTRNGALKIDEDGYLSTLTGLRLSDQIQIPPDAAKMQISTDGVVKVLIGEDVLEVGEIQLAKFINDQALESAGQGLYIPADDAGAPLYSQAGSNGLGMIQQGFLESSNVDLVKELVELVTAQRGYQANSHVIRAADEIMQITNDLRG